MEKITTSILPSAWAISFFIACYVAYLEYAKPELGFTLKQKDFFLDINRRRKYIGLSFIFLFMPYDCLIDIHFLGGYPNFNFSHIQGTFEALSYLAFPISSSTLAVSSQFSLPMINTNTVQESKPLLLLVQQNIPQIQTYEYFEQTPINIPTDNLINDSVQTSNERIIEAKDCSTESAKKIYEKYSYIIDCSFEVFTDFVNGNVNLTEPIKLKSKSKGDRNTTKTALIDLIYDIFPFEDLKTKTRKEHLFLINQKYKCFENIYNKKEISLKELINFENKRKKESEKVKNRK